MEKNPKIQVHIAASCDAPDDFLWGDFVANQVPRCVASSQTGWRGDLQAVPFFLGPGNWKIGITVFLPCQEFRTKMCVISIL